MLYRAQMFEIRERLSGSDTKSVQVNTYERGPIVM